MRIVGGQWRGRRLAVPRGRDVRPSADRLRESLFNILAHGPWQSLLAGARVGDLFAGTGALGLEALSRGAAEAVFVEKAAASRKVLHANIAALGVGDRASVLTADARRLPALPAPRDLVFLDPPYRRDLATPALMSLLDAGWLAGNALVVVETAADESLALPAGLAITDRRRLGDSRLWFLTREGS
ncbi:MAG: 16S rRNA (guanine(966)-N(2))-methyltransferase RsmD [Alphaproteobacteria bacterium]|nr:MAG: 16S rRNA (guanine(966)-N(2))-methyltransferase RsmD [Alphaproteobacteria bacterium]